MANPDLKLSTHFTLREAMKSEVALRHGIDNTPPGNVAASLVRVAEEILEPVRKLVGKGFSPSSWYRCPELNLLLGSSRTSQHTQGQAVDFEVAGYSNLELAELVRDNCDFDQLILEFYDPADPQSGWVHVSYVSAVENRRQILTTQNGRDFHVGLPDNKEL